MDPLVHEPTPACEEWHCYWHNVDEPAEGYQLCFECKHMFITEAELVAAYLASAPPDLPLVFAPPTGRSILFCPLCSHDFLWRVQ